MTDKCIFETVDIVQCPEVDDNYPGEASVQITMGDAHGNALNLLFLLVKHGIATNITTEKYQQFVALYCQSFDAPIASVGELLRQFESLLDSTDFNPAVTLRFLGDLLADRGANDYFTLRILQRLKVCGVRYEILLSNHDFEFIKNYEDPEADFSYSQINRLQSASMLNMSTWLKEGYIEREFINELMQQCYLPALKVLSYSINQEDNEITLFSHAPIGLPNIACLAENFSLSYNDASLGDLAQTIDSINQLFVDEFVNVAQISELVGGRGISGEYHPQQEPVGFVIWNRQTEGLLRPQVLAGYTIKYVHGHHRDEDYNPPPYIINLDNELGKTDHFKTPIEHGNQGIYTVLYSTGTGVLQKKLVAVGAIATSMDPTRTADELELWLNAFSIQCTEWMKRNQENQVITTFLVRLRALATAASQQLLYADEQLVAMGCAEVIASACGELLNALSDYLKSANGEQFNGLCQACFLRIQQHRQPTVYTMRGGIFDTLAQAVERLGTGLSAEMLLTTRTEKVSDNPSTWFALPAGHVAKVVEEKPLDSDRDSDEDLYVESEKKP